MGVFENNSFKGQVIHVDGHRFVGNHFQDCVLIYGGGPLHMVDNVLNNVQWKFVDAAARTVSLISSLYQSGGESRQFVELLLSTSGKQTEEPAPPAPSGPTPQASPGT